MKPKGETNIVSDCESAGIRRCGGAPRGAETVSRNSPECGGSELRVRRRPHFWGDGECPGKVCDFTLTTTINDQNNLLRWEILVCLTLIREVKQTPEIGQSS